MIELEKKYLDVVRAILRREVPGYEVRVFGSRVSGKASPYSDLDLALVGPAPLTVGQLGRLQDALSASDLPIMVDVVDWQAITPEFRRIIERQYEVLPLAD